MNTFTKKELFVELTLIILNLTLMLLGKKNNARLNETQSEEEVATGYEFRTKGTYLRAVWLHL